jgi:hypothetical protein
VKRVDYQLELERRAYAVTKNPLHAWAAYAIARRGQREIPEWVLVYLDKAQRGLMFNVQDAFEKRGTMENLGPLIARAFGMASPGKGTPLDFEKNWWRHGLAVRTFLARGDQLDHARSFAAQEFGVHRSTIRRNAALFDEVCPVDDKEFKIDEDDLPDPPEDIEPSVPFDDEM